MVLKKMDDPNSLWNTQTLPRLMAIENDEYLKKLCRYINEKSIEINNVISGETKIYLRNNENAESFRDTHILQKFIDIINNECVKRSRVATEPESYPQLEIPVKEPEILSEKTQSQPTSGNIFKTLANLFTPSPEYKNPGKIEIKRYDGCKDGIPQLDYNRDIENENNQTLYIYNGGDLKFYYTKKPTRMRTTKYTYEYYIPKDDIRNFNIDSLFNVIDYELTEETDYEISQNELKQSERKRLPDVASGNIIKKQNKKGINEIKADRANAAAKHKQSKLEDEMRKINKKIKSEKAKIDAANLIKHKNAILLDRRYYERKLYIDTENEPFIYYTDKTPDQDMPSVEYLLKVQFNDTEIMNTYIQNIIDFEKTNNPNIQFDNCNRRVLVDYDIDGTKILYHEIEKDENNLPTYWSFDQEGIITNIKKAIDINSNGNIIYEINDDLIKVSYTANGELIVKFTNDNMFKIISVQKVLNENLQELFKVINKLNGWLKKVLNPPKEGITPKKREEMENFMNKHFRSKNLQINFINEEIYPNILLKQINLKDQFLINSDEEIRLQNAIIDLRNIIDLNLGRNKLKVKFAKKERKEQEARQNKYNSKVKGLEAGERKDRLNSYDY
jgi:hypothetical protein